jgi:hypothetical protein
MTAYIIILIIIFFTLLIFVGFYRFQASALKEKDALFNQYGKVEILVTEADLNALPSIMQNYLQKVGVVGKCKDCHVIFKQTGKIKTAAGKKWTPFKATQYMTASSPNFIWNAQAFPVFIRDKCINGKGEVRVSLFGLKELAKIDGAKTDQSALARCLGELMFYPLGFLSDTISWEVLGNDALMATVKIDDVMAQGIFYLNDAGLLYRFESNRYMNESLEKFTGVAEDYKMMEGLFIPSRMKASWNLKAGDFEYFNSTITTYKID